MVSKSSSVHPSDQKTTIIGHPEGSDRFRKWLPLIARLINRPGLTLLSSAALATPLSFLSPHYALMPFCFWIFLWSLHLDGAMKNRLLIPPLGTLTLMSTLGAGIGVPMVVSSLETNLSEPHLIIQLVFILGSPMLFLGYRLGRGSVGVEWWNVKSSIVLTSMRRPMVGMALFLCIFDVARMAVCWWTDRLDRGYGGEVMLSQGMGPWTFFEMFTRWHTIWFFFVPVLWVECGRVGRSLITGAATFCIILAVASGSRGLVFRPVIYLLLGLYFHTSRKAIRIERWIPFGIPLALCLIWTMDIYRSSTEFQNTKLTDISQRLSAVRVINDEAVAREGFNETTGNALIAFSDALVYEGTPRNIPYAGIADILPAVLWTWVPQLLAPNKPTLADANEIVISYTGLRHERSFNSISLSADLFRRVGWVGLFFGLPCYGVIYGLLVRMTLKSLVQREPVFGLIMLTLLIGSLQVPLTNTVLGTWWIFAYDLPKHLLPLVVLSWILRAPRSTSSLGYQS